MTDCKRMVATKKEGGWSSQPLLFTDKRKLGKTQPKADRDRAAARSFQEGPKTSPAHQEVTEERTSWEKASADNFIKKIQCNKGASHEFSLSPLVRTLSLRSLNFLLTQVPCPDN